MLHNDAVESNARRRNGSQIARSRTPRAQQFLLYAWRKRASDLRRTVGWYCLDALWMLLARCLDAASMLLGRCSGAA
eukprot:10581680-Lingulodinium_polyedra.AAC.1